MAIFKEFLGKGVCTDSGETPYLGNDYGCLKVLGNMRRGAFKKRSVKYPLTTDFNDDFLFQEEQKGNMIVLPLDTKFAQAGGENSKTADALGVNTLQLKGLVEFVCTITATQHYYKQISKLSSFKEWEFVVIDDKDTMLWVENSTEVKGLDVGLITDDAQKFGTQGGDAGSKSFYFQLINREELDKSLSPLLKANHGIDFSEHSGISEVIVDIVGAGAGSTLNVKVSKTDKKTPLLLLETKGMEVVKDDNSIIAVTAIAKGASDEDYVLTLATPIAVADKIKARTKDATLNATAVRIGNYIYGGMSAEAVVA